MGLGRFGGGLGVTRYLLREGACVILNDLSSAEVLSGPLAQIGRHEHLSVELGHHDPELLNGIDMLVVNPAVPKPWDHPMIQAAVAKGIRVTTEIEIAYRQLDPAQLIAVTGSAGKSTTSAMTHHALQELGIPTILGGNIGGSLLYRLDEITPESTIVLELSSAMLYWLWGRNHADPVPHPAVSCVTSYSSNHLDWHANESHYLDSKRKILHPDKTSVFPEHLLDWTVGKSIIVKEAESVFGCAVPGAHNAMNAALASACVRAIHPELDDSLIHDAVRSFPGLPHRLHRSFECEGVTYFDDSKSTTPQATLLAVESLKSIVQDDAIHLIAGGYDKGSDLSLISNLAPRLAGLYCIGATAQSIASRASSNTYLCDTIEIAMERIHSRISKGDLVLLSPGCASWDQFENYEQRGARFTELARAQKRTTA